MSDATATIRELRLNFRSVKRKIEEYGAVVITDNGIPSFVIKGLAPARPEQTPPPDYYLRLLKQQPRPISAEETKQLHEENRGDR